jgi:hypothetical protein
MSESKTIYVVTTGQGAYYTRDLDLAERFAKKYSGEIAMFESLDDALEKGLALKPLDKE